MRHLDQKKPQTLSVMWFLKPFNWSEKKSVLNIQLSDKPTKLHKIISMLVLNSLFFLVLQAN